MKFIKNKDIDKYDFFLNNIFQKLIYFYNIKKKWNGI